MEEQVGKEEWKKGDRTELIWPVDSSSGEGGKEEEEEDGLRDDKCKRVIQLRGKFN
jgi:hypothetical protein